MKARRRSAAAAQARAALQFAWRKIIGGRDRPKVSDALAGLRQHLHQAGSEIEVAEAAFRAGLIPWAKVDKFVEREKAETRSPLGAMVRPSLLQISEFYESRAWRRLAYETKLRDGRRCACCGASPKDGARIVSDHIQPLRLRWDLRLEPSNIQILCNDCNLGKGSWDETKF